ncbi:type II toxin-antitoxin system RelE/ParE family toxin [Slackia equolifaciens]
MRSVSLLLLSNSKIVRVEAVIAMEIRFYKNVNGNAPVEEYLDGLPRKLREKTLRSIALLKAYGHALREPESKYLEDGIFEPRSTFGGDTGRVLYFFFHEGSAVLTHGFEKKSRKTPRSEIERAKRYRRDYCARHDGCGGCS